MSIKTGKTSIIQIVTAGPAGPAPVQPFPTKLSCNHVEIINDNPTALPTDPLIVAIDPAGPFIPVQPGRSYTVPCTDASKVYVASSSQYTAVAHTVWK
jgi:hypothetical protein